MKFFYFIAPLGSMYIAILPRWETISVYFFHSVCNQLTNFFHSLQVMWIPRYLITASFEWIGHLKNENCGNKKVVSPKNSLKKVPLKGSSKKSPKKLCHLRNENCGNKKVVFPNILLFK